MILDIILYYIILLSIRFYRLVVLVFNVMNRFVIEERISNLIPSAAPLVDCNNNKFHKDQIIVPS